MEKLQKTITELNDKLKKKNKTPEEQDEEFEQFYECIKDIATHPVVLRMKLYPHHRAQQDHDRGVPSAGQR